MRGRAVKLDSGLVDFSGVMSGWVPWMRENSRRCECHSVGPPVNTICNIVSGIRGLGDDTQHGLDDLGRCSIILASHLIGPGS